MLNSHFLFLNCMCHLNFVDDNFESMVVELHVEIRADQTKFVIHLAANHAQVASNTILNHDNMRDSYMCLVNYSNRFWLKWLGFNDWLDRLDPLVCLFDINYLDLRFKILLLELKILACITHNFGLLNHDRNQVLINVLKRGLFVRVAVLGQVIAMLAHLL